VRPWVQALVLPKKKKKRLNKDSWFQRRSIRIKALRQSQMESCFGRLKANFRHASVKPEATLEEQSQYFQKAVVRNK
jgi:hypothetical protein